MNNQDAITILSGKYPADGFNIRPLLRKMSSEEVILVAREALAFIRDKDLVDHPENAAETLDAAWRMDKKPFGLIFVTESDVRGVANDMGETLDDTEVRDIIDNLQGVGVSELYEHYRDAISTIKGK